MIAYLSLATKHNHWHDLSRKISHQAAVEIEVIKKQAIFLNEEIEAVRAEINDLAAASVMSEAAPIVLSVTAAAAE